jgi:hypothetical protein
MDFLNIYLRINMAGGMQTTTAIMKIFRALIAKLMGYLKVTKTNDPY